MFTILSQLHRAVPDQNGERALGLLAGAYQAMEQWAVDGAPQHGLSAIAWANLHQPPVEVSAFTAPKPPVGAMKQLPPLSQPSTMAALAASTKDLVAVNKLREEERECAKPA